MVLPGELVEEEEEEEDEGDEDEEGEQEEDEEEARELVVPMALLVGGCAGACRSRAGWCS